MNKQFNISLLIVLLSFTFFLRSQAKEITIVAENNLQVHAIILQKYLKKAFVKDDFKFRPTLSKKGEAIVLRINSSLEEEEFKIQSKEENNRIVLGVEAGGNSGLHYATFQLLEKLKFGFFLSFELIPENTKEINLRGIDISDKPLTPERIVFNWHNFLSGCSAWNLEEWKQYIDQASKMRFNGLMTHFYANDPTFIFSHNEVEKVAGFMPNTKKGRQYGTQQVNDVRRLYGGEVFDSPVFGSNASKVADENRVEEARKLMQKVHDYATSKYMDIWFGLDIDAQLANPQEIMKTLPEMAKIKVKQKANKYFGTPDSVFYLPIPDSPGGYAYYKSQINQLFQQFPEIDNIVLWTRTSGSPFLTLKYNDFPENWKLEFDQIAATNNKINKNDKNITGRFATSKIYKAVRKVLNETGKEDIKLWAGSWRTSWLEQADWFYPKEVGFIPLDYHVDYFLFEEKHQVLKTIAENRKIIPIVWAHHDDGAFIGAPYQPYKNLQLKVESVGNSGIGVIHWTTKPLDIYFKNTEQQFWTSTKNAGLKESADFFAERLVKTERKKLFSKYLENWIESGPRFGRETRTWFIDHKIRETDFKETIEECKERLELLNKINEPRNLQLQYFKGLEEFCVGFYQTQYNFQIALEACKTGDYVRSVQFLSKCQPEKVIEKYAEISRINGITKGEKGVIIEMNLSWLPFINSLRQTLRKQPVYYNFGTVNFPDLGVGLLNTNYFMDIENHLWRNYGEVETGAKVVQNKQNGLISEKNFINEIASEGIESGDALEIELQPYAADISPGALKNPDYFIPGKYKLTLIFYAAEQGRFDVYVRSKKNGEVLNKEKVTMGKNKLITKSFYIQLKSADSLKLTAKNTNSSVCINGAILEPINSKK